MANEPLFKELGLAATEKSLTWVHLTDLADNIATFGLAGTPAKFDRIYSDAAAIWTSLGAVTSVIPPSDAVDLTALHALIAR
jgi:hypothetical protein